jgi:hypothetical protein
MYITNGISDLKEMKKHYNSFAPGGPIETDEYGYPADITPAIVEANYPRENEVWKKADASNADMVQRLKQGSSRVTIPDWEDPRKVATHKMMSAGNYAVGNVQNINGQLFDFTDPKHGFKNSDRAAIDSAIERGDYIEFDTEGDARYFAEHYKKHYNSFSGEESFASKVSKYPEVTIKEEPWADAYFKQHPEVAGMAIGAGLNGVDGPRRVIINPYSKNINKDAVLLNERSRHYMEESNFKLPKVTDEQMKKYEGTPYQNDTLNVGRTEAARFISGDKHLLTPEQIEYVNSFSGEENTNKKAFIGTHEVPAQIDNTRTYNTKNNTFIRHEGTPNLNIVPSDLPLGLLPYIGDALQVLDIPFNIANKQYGMAALNAGLLFVPNLIEKPIKWLSKGIKSRKLAKALAKAEIKPMKSNTDLEIPIAEKERIAGNINSIDDITLDPYARTEVPEEAFMPKEKEVIQLSPTQQTKEKEKFVEDVIAGAHFARKNPVKTPELKEFKIDEFGSLDEMPLEKAGAESAVYIGDDVVYKRPKHPVGTRIIRSPNSEIEFVLLPEFKDIQSIKLDADTYLGDLNKYWFQEPTSLEGYLKWSDEWQNGTTRYLPVYSQPKGIKDLKSADISIKELKQYDYLKDKIHKNNIFLENDLPIPHDTHGGNFMVFPDGVVRAVDVHSYGGKLLNKNRK